MYGLGSAIVNITEQAMQGKILPAYGRDKEIESALDVLSWMHPKQILVVGPSGVGKTRFVHGLATVCARRGQSGVTPVWRILQFHVSVLRCGTVRVFDGVTRLLKSTERCSGDILFLDGIFPVLTRPRDHKCAVSLLAESIRSVHVRCIGTMNEEEFKALKDHDRHAFDKFTVISLAAMSEEQTSLLLRNIRPSLESEFGIRIPDRALSRTIELAREYAPESPFPGKGVTALRMACSLCSQRAGSNAARAVPMPQWVIESSLKQLGSEVMTTDLIEAVSQLTSKDIAQAEAGKWRGQFSRRMRANVFGQNGALDQIADTMARIRDQFLRSPQVVYSMLFVGPRGVGKRHTAEIMFHVLAGDGVQPVVFDMRRYSDTERGSRFLANSVTIEPSRDTQSLVKSLRKLPLTVCVFDGIERAHSSVSERIEVVLKEGSFASLPEFRDASGKCIIVLVQHSAPPPGDFRRMPVWLKECVIPVISRKTLECVETLVPFRSLDAESISDIVDQRLASFHDELVSTGTSVEHHNAVRPWLVRKVLVAGEGVSRLEEVFQGALVMPLRAVLAQDGSGGARSILARVERDRLAFDVVRNIRTQA